MLTIAQFKAKIPGKIHGSQLTKFQGNFYTYMHEAAGNFLARVKPYSIIRSARIENAIYDKVYNYAIEDDCEQNSIIDIRPIGPRKLSDTLSGSFSQEFDIRKEENTFYVEHVNAQKTLRLSKKLSERTILMSFDSLTIDGTITLGGDASNPSIDTLDYVSGSGSYSFDLSGVTGQATVTIDLSTKIDLSDMRKLGSLFEWLKFSTTSLLTNVTLKFGSSSGKYWYKTVTAAHDRAWEDNAWMLLRHDWTTATEVGSPVEADSEEIDYLQIVINYTSGTALTGIKLDNITASKGEAWESLYYSNRLFTDTLGTTWKETPTADTDIIRLEGATDINAFLYEFMLITQQELKGANMAVDFSFFKDQLQGNDKREGLYDLLQAKYPNQAVVRSITYYDFDSLSGE